MLKKYLPYVVYLSIVATGAIQAYQEDWMLLAFGFAATGVILVLLAGLLFLATLLAGAIDDLLQMLGIHGTSTLILQFCFVAATAATHCTLVFVLCFARQPALFDEPELVMSKLLWVTGVACLPWADFMREEKKAKHPVPFQDLILLATALGGLLVSGTCAWTQAPLSWPLVAGAFAGALSATLVFYIANRIPNCLSPLAGEAGAAR